MKNLFNKLLILSTLLCLSVLNAQEIITDEGFDDISNLAGWEFTNNSSPIGDSNWFQGNDDLFAALAGDTDSYIAANHRNVESLQDSSGVICNFMVAPDLGALESIKFFTRSTPASNNYNIFPDRLYVVYSPDGGTNTGNCVDNFGDFTETLLVVNEDLSEDGYALTGWEEFNLDINGSGRIAFVYYVPDAGFYGTNSNYIGIDSFSWVFQAPTSDENTLFSSSFEIQE